MELKTGNLPFGLFLVGIIAFPLQGLLNVLVYIRLHVISLRDRCPHYTWRKTIWVVLNRGGDHAGVASRHQRNVRRLSWISRQNPLPPSNRNALDYPKEDTASNKEDEDVTDPNTRKITSFKVVEEDPLVLR